MIQEPTGSYLTIGQTSYSEEFGDGIRLGAAHAAVTRPHDPPLTVGDGVRLLRAVQPHSHHPPVVTRPRGQSLIREEVPFAQAGDADRRLQDRLHGESFLVRIRLSRSRPSCRILWKKVKLFEITVCHLFQKRDMMPQNTETGSSLICTVVSVI